MAKHRQMVGSIWVNLGLLPLKFLHMYTILTCISYYVYIYIHIIHIYIYMHIIHTYIYI